MCASTFLHKHIHCRSLAKCVYVARHNIILFGHNRDTDARRFLNLFVCAFTFLLSFFCSSISVFTTMCQTKNVGQMQCSHITFVTVFALALPEMSFSGILWLYCRKDRQQSNFKKNDTIFVRWQNAKSRSYRTFNIFLFFCVIYLSEAHVLDLHFLWSNRSTFSIYQV